MSRIAIKGETDPDKVARYRARRQYSNWRKGKEGRMLIATLFAQVNGMCPICGTGMVLRFDGVDCADMATLDHVVPLSLTNTFSPEDEFQIMCQHCNVKKSNDLYINDYPEKENFVEIAEKIFRNY